MLNYYRPFYFQILAHEKAFSRLLEELGEKEGKVLPNISAKTFNNQHVIQ